MEPLISVQLRNSRRVYRPGDLLEYEYQIDAVDAAHVQAVESSVLWYTEGKGQSNMAVHDFERRVPGDAAGGDLRQLWCASTRLPNSPLSYTGVILRIRWCVRVRVFLRRGKEASFEQPFQLSDVPPAKAIGNDFPEKADSAA